MLTLPDPRKSGSINEGGVAGTGVGEGGKKQKRRKISQTHKQVHICLYHVFIYYCIIILSYNQ